ncbi:hypothetical protein CHS0354_041297 [Potamilus streckersoni]|uniref:Helicase POLQ-like n=1 Tax=Potamilus streckersoni TaxID=2493646 RepID=A0AAE0SE44_9BIVA|nr:hypothetical protein CHS0354_041297 [Potamilus streckersoni]
MTGEMCDHERGPTRRVGISRKRRSHEKLQHPEKKQCKPSSGDNSETCASKLHVESVGSSGDASVASPPKVSSPKRWFCNSFAPSTSSEVSFNKHETAPAVHNVQSIKSDRNDGNEKCTLQRNDKVSVISSDGISNMQKSMPISKLNYKREIILPISTKIIDSVKSGLNYSAQSLEMNRQIGDMDDHRKQVGEFPSTSTPKVKRNRASPVHTNLNDSDLLLAEIELDELKEGSHSCNHLYRKSDSLKKKSLVQNDCDNILTDPKAKLHSNTTTIMGDNSANVKGDNSFDDLYRDSFSDIDILDSLESGKNSTGDFKVKLISEKTSARIETIGKYKMNDSTAKLDYLKAQPKISSHYVSEHKDHSSRNSVHMTPVASSGNDCKGDKKKLSPTSDTQHHENNSHIVAFGFNHSNEHKTQEKRSSNSTPVNLKNNISDLSISKSVHSNLAQKIPRPTTPGFSPLHDRIKRKLLENAGIKTPQGAVSVMNQLRDENLQKAHQEAAQIQAEGTNIDIGPFYGLPSKVKQLFETQRGIKELYTWQDECLRLPTVLKGGNLIYTLPTSGGKTLVAEILILRELLCKKKDALLILPFVSIVQEKVRSLSQFAVDLDFLVEEYAGSKGRFPCIKRRKTKSLYIATIEKAHSIINSLIENKHMDSLGLVVVDELHMIGEGGHRGAILESTIIKILYASENTQIIGMSATLSNIADLRLFLKADVYNSDFRPVELTEYVKLDENIYSIDPKSKCTEDQFKHDRLVMFQYIPEMLKIDCDHLFGLILEVIPDKSCLLFCPTKKNCENVAMMLAKMMMKFRRDLSNVKRVERKALLKELCNDADGKICPVLQYTVHFGIAYHHSGLTMDERKLLEEAYSEGTLCLLTCTSTLAAGVNLPAKRVILRSPYVGQQFMSRSQYKQMVGRAGRAGLDNSGESILITKPADKEKVYELVSGPLGSCHSSLLYDEGKGLQNIMLSTIGLAITPTTKDVFQFMEKSLLNIQQAVLQADMSALCCNALQKLIDLKLVVQKKAVNPSPVENHELRLEVTPLGRAAFKGPVDLEYAGLLYLDLKKAEESLVLSNYLHLLYLVTPYDAVKDVSPSWMIYFSQMNTLDPDELKVAALIGVPDSYIVKKAAAQKPKQVLDEFVVNRFYLTLMLYDLWRQRSVWEVAEKFQIPRGFIQNLLTGTASFATCVLHFCEELDEFWAFQDLLGNFVKRLTYCVTAELIPLMEIPGVKLGRAKLLFSAGFKTLSSIANADPEALVKGLEYMPRKVARQIVTSAKALIQEKTEALMEEVEKLVTIPDTTWKKSEASPDQIDTETKSDAVSLHLSQRSTLSFITIAEEDSQTLL